MAFHYFRRRHIFLFSKFWILIFSRFFLFCFADEETAELKECLHITQPFKIKTNRIFLVKSQSENIGILIWFCQTELSVVGF